MKNVETLGGFRGTLQIFAPMAPSNGPFYLTLALCYLPGEFQSTFARISEKLRDHARRTRIFVEYRPFVESSSKSAFSEPGSLRNFERRVAIGTDFRVDGRPALTLSAHDAHPEGHYLESHYFAIMVIQQAYDTSDYVP